MRLRGIACKSALEVCIVLIMVCGFCHLVHAVSNDALKVWPRPYGTYNPNAGEVWTDHLARGFNAFWSNKYDEAYTEWEYEVQHNTQGKIKTKIFQTTCSLRGLAMLSIIRNERVMQVNSMYANAIRVFNLPHLYMDYGMFLMSHNLYDSAAKMMSRAIEIDPNNVAYRETMRKLKCLMGQAQNCENTKEGSVR